MTTLPRHRDLLCLPMFVNIPPSAAKQRKLKRVAKHQDFSFSCCWEESRGDDGRVMTTGPLRWSAQPQLLYPKQAADPQEKKTHKFPETLGCCHPILAGNISCIPKDVQ